MTTWAITSMVTALQADGFTNVVKQVNWLVTDAVGDYEAKKGGTIELATLTEPFTPYEQLTEQEVIDWVKASLGQEQVLAIETDLANQLVYMQNPPVTVLPNPWIKG